MALNPELDKIRGRVNTKIRLRIVRNGQDAPIDSIDPELTSRNDQ